MGAPLTSTIVDTAGTSPSTSWAEPLATTADARLDSRPKPPAMGNMIAAAITAAKRMHQANLMTVTVIGGVGVGRSDMGNRVATSLVDGPGVPGLAAERGLRFGQGWVKMDPGTVVPKKGDLTVAQNPPDHLAWTPGAI